MDIEKTLEQLEETDEMTIGDRCYQFIKIPHEKRLMVFSFYSAHVQAIEVGDFSFFGFDQNFKKIRTIIESCLKCDGALLSTKKQHWDEYPSDFMPIIMTSFVYFSKPFFLENELS